MKHLLKSSLAGYGVLCLLSSAFAAAEGTITQVPALADEDLLSALKRVHPCLQSSHIKIPSEVFFLNPERANAQGKMVLTGNTLKVPTSFMDTAQNCKKAEAVPVAAVAPHEELKTWNPFETPSEAPHATSVDPQTHEEEHGKHASTIEHEHENEGPQLKNKLTLSTFIDFAKLSANVFQNSTQPTLISKMQPGFEVEYEREIKPRTSMGISYRFTKTAYQEQDGLEFSELSTTLNEMVATANYEVNETVRVSFAAGATQIDDLKINDDLKLTIDHTWRPTLGFAVSKELAHVLSLGIEGTVGAQLFLPTNAQQSFGLLEFGKLTFERHLSHRWVLELGLSTSTELQSTQVEYHSVWSLAFGLGLSYRF